MVTGPEIMRQVHVDVYGEPKKDPHVEDALELRRRWLLVRSELDEGGQLYLEKPGVTAEAGGNVVIAWRRLNDDYTEDYEIIKRLAALNEHLPERVDWLVGIISGDTVVTIPHSLKLLTPYELPVEVL